MNFRSPWTLLIVLLPIAFLVWLFIRPHLASPLTPQELHGKQIYFEGTSPVGGKIIAYIGKEHIKLPGSAAACGSCHGPDGRGRPEAGVIPSDITWGHLMKSYGHSHPMGRKHAAFTEASLKRCILNGDDPDGNRMDASMPTYAMSVENINALIAYLKRLQGDVDPGLEEKSIRIATMLPSSGRTAGIGQAMVAVMAAYFEEINAQGGIYNRKLELIASPYDAAGQSALSRAAHLMDGKDIFALVGAVIAGMDRQMAQLAEDKKVPLIGPFTLSSTDTEVLNEFTFYLFSGLREQVRALIEFAAQDLKLADPRIAILGMHDDPRQDLQTAIITQSKSRGWTSVAGFKFVPDPVDASAAARAFKQQGVDAIFYLGFEGLKTLLDAAQEENWRPLVFLPGALVKRELLELPVSFQNKIFLSYPTLPSDRTPGGKSEFEGLLKAHAITVNHLTSQISALVAAKILVEGLRRSGRDLSREKFIHALEELYDFRTGLTPRITYGPNRRIGAMGAHIATIDLEKNNILPVGRWIALSRGR